MTCLGNIAKKSGLKSQELVEIHERKLIEKNLLIDRRLSDRSGVDLGSFYRLTPLALEICQFIARFDIEKTE